MRGGVRGGNRSHAEASRGVPIESPAAKALRTRDPRHIAQVSLVSADRGARIPSRGREKHVAKVARDGLDRGGAIKGPQAIAVLEPRVRPLRACRVEQSPASAENRVQRWAAPRRRPRPRPLTRGAGRPRRMEPAPSVGRRESMSGIGFRVRECDGVSSGSGQCRTSSRGNPGKI